MASTIITGVNTFDGVSPDLLTGHHGVVEDGEVRQDDRLGVIRPGAHADLLLIDGNPLEDIGQPARVGADMPVIMKAGPLHRNPL